MSDTYFDFAQVYALAGVLLCPSVGARVIDAGGPMVFADALCGTLAELIAGSDTLAADLERLAESDDRAGELVDAVLAGVDVLHASGDGEAWALDLVDRLAQERALGILAPTFRWAADAIEHGHRALGAVLVELNPVIVAATTGGARCMNR